jgi:catechol 2,3-dioxygenase-like lactoylglutathione lyase family enzyme
MNTNKKLRVAAALVLIASQAGAQQSDVTFFVIGKHANYQQDPSGDLSPVDFSFFSEIFLTANGDASNAILEFPTGEKVAYRDMRNVDGGRRDNIFLVSGEDRFTRFSALQARYPDGRYAISFDSPSGALKNGELRFEKRPLPTPPVISVSQGGTDNCTVLTPGADATVHWQPFTDGRADPNGILDDLIFVILTDADGQRVAHSGRPFEPGSYLTYADNSFTINGAVLKAGATYTLSVEHALLDDTTRFATVPAFTTRAVTSKLELSTLAENLSGCSAPPSIPSLDSQVTMFYYDDLDAAANFYGNILGLEVTFDWDWVKFFKTGPSSSVGIVKQGDGAFHDVQKTNAVMLSLVTSEVDAWYSRLGDRDDLKVLKPIGSGGGIRSFLLEDPGGYTVEFFQWLDAED